MSSYLSYLGGILARSTQTGCLIFDRNGVLKFANQSISNYLNISPEDISEISLRHILTEKEFHYALNSIREFLGGGSFSEDTWTITSIDGKPYKFRIEPFKVHVEGEDQICVLVHDAKDKALKERLIESKKKQEYLTNQQKLAISTAKLGVWKLNLATGETTWNDEMLKMYDLTRVEFEQDQNIWQGLVHPDDAEFITEKLGSIAEGQTVSDIEFRIITRSGDIRFVQASGAPLFDEGGNINEITGVNIDITHLRKTKTDLEYKNYEQNLSIKTARLGIWKTLFETGELVWNEQMFEIFEVDERDFDGTIEFFQKMVHPEDQDLANERMSKIAEGESVYDVRFRIITPKGNIKHIDASGAPLYNDNEQIIGITGVNIDITELKKATYQAEIANAKFRSLIDSSPSAVYQIDKNGVITDFWNTAAEKIFGWTKKEVLGKFMPHLRGKDIDEFKAIIKQIKSSKKPSHFQVKRVRKDGESISLDITAGPLFDENGELTDLLIIASDITELEKYRASIEFSLKEKEVLLMEIHHRVKNNLAIISGLLDLQIFRLEDPAHHKVLLDARNRIQSIAMVHEQLYQEMEFSSIHLDSYYPKLFENLENNLAEKGQDINYELNLASTRLNINRAVPMGLLITEFFINSVKYAMQGNKLNLKLQIRSEDEIIHVIYEDDGPGFDLEKIKEKKSLGWELIQTILSQLNATYTVDTNDKFRIEFSFIENFKGAHAAHLDSLDKSDFYSSQE